MAKKIKVQNIYTSINRDVYLNTVPDNCPICHKYQEPRYIYSMALDSENKIIEAVFKCTNLECRRMFISKYGISMNPTHYLYFTSYPSSFSEKQFEEEIKSISKDFSEIYNQALNAEFLELKHVAGMGYRKALEFLIKDYLIEYKNEDRNRIESKFLGKCINEDIDNLNVKEIAKRAAWLGNDETHYVREWVDKDIKDLKKLIDITRHWIVHEVQTKKIIKEMHNNR